MTIKRLIWKFRIWWYANAPVFCFQYRKLIRYKNAIHERHHVAGYVPLCKECWHALFAPHRR